MSICQITHHGHQHEFSDLEAAQAFLDQLPSPRDDLEIVGGSLLFRLLNEIGAPMHNWREINQEICNEWTRMFQQIQSETDMMRTAERRASLLETFKVVMDVAESTVVADDLEGIRTARDQQYKIFIYQEAMVGENVCVETLYAITQREIDAGRMPLDHSCRQIAEDAMAEPHSTRAQLLSMKEEKDCPEPSLSLSVLQKIMKWFSKN